MNFGGGGRGIKPPAFKKEKFSYFSFLQKLQGWESKSIFFFFIRQAGRERWLIAFYEVLHDSFTIDFESQKQKINVCYSGMHLDDDTAFNQIPLLKRHSKCLAEAEHELVCSESRMRTLVRYKHKVKPWMNHPCLLDLTGESLSPYVLQWEGRLGEWFWNRQ